MLKHHVMYTGRRHFARLVGTSSYGLPSRRCYAWKTNPAFEAEAQPTVISDDGSKTLRTRQHGNRSLPLPPIMDPIAIAGKQRHKQMKQRVMRNDELSDFQKKLRLNPYAHALATEIRQCRINQASLPSHFLIPFAADVPSPSERDEAPRKPSLAPALRNKVQGKTYVTGTREALESISGKKGRWQALLNEHVKARAALAMGKELGPKDWTWDGDMAGVVLAQLRENVMDALNYCLKKNTLILDLVEDDPVERDDLACVLIVGNPAPAAEAASPAKVPIYNLEALLAPDQLESFVQGSGRKALVKHKGTMPAVVALEKLRNYVAGNGNNTG